MGPVFTPRCHGLEFRRIKSKSPLRTNTNHDAERQADQAAK